MSKRVIVQFAVPQEMAPFLKRIDRRGHLAVEGVTANFGRVGDLEIGTLAGGMGPKSAATSLQRFLKRWTPDLILMTGVAGALDPTLAIGDLVLGTEIQTGGSRIRAPLVPLVPGSVRKGVLLSSERVLVTAENKRQAFEASGGDALAVEMETAAIASVADAAGIPWGALRGISDTAAECLPLDFNQLQGSRDDLPVSRIALAALARPSSIPGLMRLGRNTATAAEAVAAQLAPWLQTGCPAER